MMPSNSSGGNSANASKNLLNQAQGFAGPGSTIMSGFQSSLGTAEGSQASELNSATNNISNLQNIASQYSPIATTGGYTPQQASQFVEQATEGTGATYGALEQQAKNNAVATGGLGTGGGLSQMARQLSQAQGTNTLNAEVALNQSQTQNKLAGLGGEAAATEAAGSQLNQLYNTTTGQVTSLGNQVLQTLGLDFSTQEQAAGILQNLSTNPTLLQSVLGGVGAVAGALI